MSKYINITPKDKRWYDLQNLPNEIWEFVKGFSNKYKISNYGRVKSLARHTTKENIRKPRIGKDGYYYLILNDCEVKKTKKIHKLVSDAFIPNPENLPQVNHIDGNKLNNYLNNLERCTRSENGKHAYRLGLNHCWMKGVIGKDCPFSKKIIQYDLDGNLIKIWDSMSDVKRELNIPVPHLVRVCKKQRNKTRGFIWRYYEGSDME